jgi:hypothetical protein
VGTYKARKTNTGVMKISVQFMILFYTHQHKVVVWRAVRACGITGPSSLLGPNILLSTLFSNTLSLRLSLSVNDHVSHSYSTTGKIIVLYILIFVFLDSVAARPVIWPCLLTICEDGSWTRLNWRRKSSTVCGASLFYTAATICRFGLGSLLRLLLFWSREVSREGS